LQGFAVVFASWGLDSYWFCLVEMGKDPGGDKLLYDEVEELWAKLS
jgi:hypothetical protein